MKKPATSFILGVLLLGVMAATFVSALPSGPTEPITPISNERWPEWGPQTLVALAGNVTQFDTNSSTITQTWQGYFGNITGMITLGDASNNTLYDWSLANPQGEIYAVRSATVPNWTVIHCANETDIATEDTALGVTVAEDEDSVNATFVIGGAPDQIARFGAAELTHPLFYVGPVTVTANSCPVAVLYNSSGMPSPYFKEVLLSDNTTNLIYTGIIAHTLNPFAESDGFDDRTHDFQMIVGEDGHGTDVATSTYYFYLELE